MVMMICVVSVDIVSEWAMVLLLYLLLLLLLAFTNIGVKGVLGFFKKTWG